MRDSDCMKRARDMAASLLRYGLLHRCGPQRMILVEGNAQEEAG